MPLMYNPSSEEHIASYLVLYAFCSDQADLFYIRFQPLRVSVTSCTLFVFKLDFHSLLQNIKRKKNHEQSLAKATRSYVKQSKTFQQVKNNALETCGYRYVGHMFNIRNRKVVYLNTKDVFEA